MEHRKQITCLLLGLTVFFLVFSTPLLIFFIFRASNYYTFTNDLAGVQELKRLYRPVDLNNHNRPATVCVLLEKLSQWILALEGSALDGLRSRQVDVDPLKRSKGVITMR